MHNQAETPPPSVKIGIVIIRLNINNVLTAPLSIKGNRRHFWPMEAPTQCFIDLADL